MEKNFSKAKGTLVVLAKEKMIGLICIDKSRHPHVGEICYSVRGFVGEFGNFENSYISECFPIEAATKELNLYRYDIPVISLELLDEEIQLGKYKNRKQTMYPEGSTHFVEGYRKGREGCYTKEQVKEIVKFLNAKYLKEFLSSSKAGIGRKEVDGYYQNLFDKIIPYELKKLQYTSIIEITLEARNEIVTIGMNEFDFTEEDRLKVVGYELTPPLYEGKKKRQKIEYAKISSLLVNHDYEKTFDTGYPASYNILYQCKNGNRLLGLHGFSESMEGFEIYTEGKEKILLYYDKDKKEIKKFSGLPEGKWKFLNRFSNIKFSFWENNLENNGMGCWKDQQSKNPGMIYTCRSAKESAVTLFKTPMLNDDPVILIEDNTTF